MAISPDNAEGLALQPFDIYYQGGHHCVWTKLCHSIGISIISHYNQPTPTSESMNPPSL